MRPRHYATAPGLVRRHTGDLSVESQRIRAQAGPIIADLLPPRPERPSLVASAGGPVTRILFTIPAYAVHSPALAAAYRDLLAKLPAETRFLVLTHESAAETVAGWSDRLDVVAGA